MAASFIFYLTTAAAFPDAEAVLDPFQTRAQVAIMFSGLVEHLGKVVDIVDASPGKRIVVNAGHLATDVQIGDSIANNGCCLTVVGIDDANLSFDAGPETLAKTNLGELTVGASVNLERSLRPVRSIRRASGDGARRCHWPYR